MPGNKNNNVRTRRRGVRASRVKLSEALARTGIKTQAALAERVADLEGLDAAPRDVVYRVFRQQPVDLNTLTRVARALDVPVHAPPSSPNVRAHLAYDYTALRTLEPRRVPDVIAGKLEGELSDAFESATDPQAFIRIASAWALLGRSEEARAAFEEGTADCAGFGASPDLDAVRPESRTIEPRSRI